MERFLKLWTAKELKRLSKEERAEMLGDFLKQILDFFQKKGHKAIAQEELNALYAIMGEKYFISTIKYMMENYEGRPDMRIVTLMVRFLSLHHKDLDPELLEQYSDVVEQLIAKPLKKIVKKVDIDDSIARELLAIVPEPSTIGGERFVGIYVGQVLRQLYALAKIETKTVEEPKEEGVVVEKTVTLSSPTEDIVSLKQFNKLFSLLFGKDMVPEVAVSILLERRQYSAHFDVEQMRIWKMLTIYALGVLDKLDKPELGKAFASYIKRRKLDAQLNRDQARRIVFDQVSEEEFPTLVKRVKQYKSDFPEEASKYL